MKVSRTISQGFSMHPEAIKDPPPPHPRHSTSFILLKCSHKVSMFSACHKHPKVKPQISLYLVEAIKLDLCQSLPAIYCHFHCTRCDLLVAHFVQRLLKLFTLHRFTYEYVNGYREAI